jgi:hypothetical protein
MSIKQKIAVYLGLIFLLIVVLAIWGYFAYHGKADLGSYISQLGGLVTIIVAAISALGGFHSGQTGSSLLAAGTAFLSDVAAPALPSVDPSVPQTPAAAPTSPAAPVVPQAGTLQ